MAPDLYEVLEIVESYIQLTVQHVCTQWTDFYGFVMLASRSTPSALEQEDSAIQTQIFFRSETQETFF